MNESDFQKRCIELIKQRIPHAIVFNIHGGGWSVKGIPDLLCCIDGRFVVFELKVGSNRLSSAQRLWKNRIRKAGGSFFSPRTFEELGEAVKELGY